MGSLLRNGCAQVFNPTAPSPALHSTRCECHSAKLPAPGQRVVSPFCPSLTSPCIQLMTPQAFSGKEAPPGPLCCFWAIARCVSTTMEAPSCTPSLSQPVLVTRIQPSPPQRGYHSRARVLCYRGALTQGLIPFLPVGLGAGSEPGQGASREGAAREGVA